MMSKILRAILLQVVRTVIIEDNVPLIVELISDARIDFGGGLCI